MRAAPSAIEEALRIHPTWINGGVDLPGPGGSVIAAAMAVPAGLCRHVLCFRTVWDRPHGAGHARAAWRTAASPGERVSGPFSEWRASSRCDVGGQLDGLNATQYLHRYGAPRETLGLIAVNGRRNAAFNPNAIYRDPMTMDR